MILKGTVTIRNEAVMVVDCGKIVVQFPASDPHASKAGDTVFVQVQNGQCKTVDPSFKEEPVGKKNTTTKKASAKAAETKD